MESAVSGYQPGYCEGCGAAALVRTRTFAETTRLDLCRRCEWELVRS